MHTATTRSGGLPPVELSPVPRSARAYPAYGGTWDVLLGPSREPAGRIKAAVMPDSSLEVYGLATHAGYRYRGVATAALAGLCSAYPRAAKMRGIMLPGSEGFWRSVPGAEVTGQGFSVDTLELLAAASG